MSTNEQYCAYIAKDKLLPYLERELEVGNDNNVRHSVNDVWLEIGYNKAMKRVKEMVEGGFFDWNRGSE